MKTSNKCIVKEIFDSSNIKMDLFIKNRFDKNKSCAYHILSLSTQPGFGYELYINNNIAYFGLWLLPLSKREIKALFKYVFKKFNFVKQIIAEYCVNKIFCSEKHNCYVLDLPSSHVLLNESVKHKHLREQFKLEHKLITEYGNKSIINYTKENCPKEIMDFYFYNKKKTHNVDYNLTKDQYFDKYSVSDIYSLYFGDKLFSVLLSCEQFENVYLENLTFDEKLSQYSPGKSIYHYFLHFLVKKGKKKIILGTGDYDYKKRYNSSCVDTYYISAYKNVLMYLFNFFKILLKRIIKK